MHEEDQNPFGLKFIEYVMLRPHLHFSDRLQFAPQHATKQQSDDDRRR